MPSTNINVQRLAQRKSSVTEIHWPHLPEPPQSIMAFPGMKEWWAQVRLTEERQQEMLYRLALTKENS